MKDRRIKDQRCWAYRLGENGETEAKIFTSRAHIPVGLGWTDSPARVHEAAAELKERQAVIDPKIHARAAKIKASEEAASLLVTKAYAELHEATCDDLDALLAMAEDFGVKIDRRWSIRRLKEEIASAYAQQPLVKQLKEEISAAVVAEVPSDDAL